MTRLTTRLIPGSHQHSAGKYRAVFGGSSHGAYQYSAFNPARSRPQADYVVTLTPHSQLALHSEPMFAALLSEPYSLPDSVRRAVVGAVASTLPGAAVTFRSRYDSERLPSEYVVARVAASPAVALQLLDAEDNIAATIADAYPEIEDRLVIIVHS